MHPSRGAAAAPPPAAAPQRVLDTREAAQLLHLSARFLRRMRAEGRGPVFVRLSDRAIGYLPADIEAWLQERRQSGQDRPGDAA